MTEIVELITTFGVVPVLIGVIIWLSIHFNKKHHEMNEKQQEMNKAQQEANRLQEERLTGMLHTVMTGVTQINDNTKLYHTKSEEDENHQAGTIINKELQRLQQVTRGSRAACFVYHNGGRDIAGRSFQKMSMLYEATDVSTSSIMLQHQNVPRMLYPVINQKIAEQRCYYVENIENIRDIDPTTYGLLVDRNVNSVFIGAILKSDDMVMGYVTIEFIAPFNGDLTRLKKELKHATTKISGVLEMSNTKREEIK